MRYTTLKYAVTGRIARITLYRAQRLNAIDDKMPGEIRRARRIGIAHGRRDPSAKPSTIVGQLQHNADCAPLGTP